MNFIEKWVESVFLKRLVLAFVAGLASAIVGHLPDFNAHLVALGISVNFDPEVFKSGLSIILFSLSQALHEHVATKYPILGKYL